MTEYCGLPLTIKEHPRAKRVLVKLVPGKGLEVVTPKRFPKKQVPAILAEKRNWIERMSTKLKADGIDLSDTPVTLPDSIEFQAMNRHYDVGYVTRSGRISVTENASRLMVSGPVSATDGKIKALKRFTTRKAREFLLPRLDRMSQELSMPYGALRVRCQKTRWGSCSARGTISVNAKLLFLPLELVDHLLLHELCHTRHLNHSKTYWTLVASHEPDFERLEYELQRGNRIVPAWFK
jgi:hypothetical protein